jgi:uncharacterized tellurite resistance protein B-like protein
MPTFAHGRLPEHMNLKEWFARHLGSARAAEADPAHGLRLAVAALLVEVLRADYEVEREERVQVVGSISGLLGLGDEESAALVAEAERHIDRSHDLYQFTSQVNRAFGDAEKMQLLEALWRVAGADATVHKYEEHLIRRIADLLHMPHSSFITAKLRASAAGGDA